jgi:ATP-binding cassette subfamily C (CFTR/MRP) protein 2
MLDEERERGQVGSNVYIQYFKTAGGAWAGVFVLSVLVLFRATQIYSQVWLVQWTDAETEQKLSRRENIYYLIVFTVFSLLSGFFTYFRAYSINRLNFLAAKRVHAAMVRSLLFAPLNEFFERVPLGRVLNRLTRDLNVLDLEMGYNIGTTLMMIVLLLGTIIMTVYSSSLWVLIPIAIFLFFSNLIRRFYMNANRELVRLERISKSPLASFFQETLGGLPSIRAYDSCQRFFLRHCHNINENLKNLYSIVLMQCWF